jgi:UDP-2,3-diacylglucosamine hydrolase
LSKTYYFISDLHLGLQSPEKEKAKENLFVDFIANIKNDADELFILGDLFDYWFEYKRVIQKGFVKTLAALQSLSEKGVKIHYLIGNHDFLHKNFFEEEIGAILYEDPLEIELNGT